MAGDPFKKVTPGSPLQIPAQAFNAFIDAAKFVQRVQKSGGARELEADAGNTIIWVKNASGSDVDQFGILGIDVPIILPGDNENEFARRVALSCITPDAAVHRDKFVVTCGPIANGKIGRAFIAGVCPVHLDIVDDAHQFAEIIDGDDTQLRTCASGSIQVQWKENAASSSDWGIIRFGGGSGGWQIGYIINVTSEAGSGDSENNYSFDLYSEGGTELATGITFDQVFSDVDYLQPPENTFVAYRIDGSSEYSVKTWDMAIDFDDCVPSDGGSSEGGGGDIDGGSA